MKNKWISLCLILAMIISLNVSASAVNADFPEGQLTEDLLGIETLLSPNSGAVVNPVFQDVQSVEDLIQPARSNRKLMKSGSVSSDNIYLAEDAEDAGNYIRNPMRDRTTTVKVSVPLNEKSAQEMSDAILAEALKHTGVPNEGDYIRYNMGGYRWIAEIDNGIANYTYTFTWYATAEQESEMTDAVNNLIQSFGFADDTSDYDKFRSIYDYMCKNIVYDEEHPDSYKLKFTSYAALIHKTAVCQGYASLFYRLALECGLRSRVVSGTGINVDGKEDHGWNIVEIDNKYYYVDATWDAVQVQAGTRYYYCLKGSKEGELVNHITGEDKTGTACYVPEELDELSVESYVHPFCLVAQTPSMTVKIGEELAVRVGAMGQNLSYKWTIRYGNGGTASGKTSGVRFGLVTESNWEQFDGMTAQCVITDGEGRTITSDLITITVDIPDSSHVAAHTMSLKGEISLNFYMELSDKVLSDPDSYIHFTVYSDEQKQMDIPVSEGMKRVIDVDGDGVEETVYRYDAVASAKDMTRPIKAELYLGSGEELTEETFTMREYALAVLDGEYTDVEKEVVRTMLNYGANAQILFDYHKDELANEGLSDTELPDVVLDDSVKSKDDGSVDGLEHVGATLMLKSATSIRHYFEIPGDISDYTFSCDGKILTPVKSKKGENWYMIELPPVPARLLGQYSVVTIRKNGSEDVETISYSGYSYAKTVLDNQETSETALVNLVKSMVIYGDAAKLYYDTKNNK